MLGSLLLAGLLWTNANTAPLSPVILPAAPAPIAVMQTLPTLKAAAFTKVAAFPEATAFTTDNEEAQELEFVALINGEREQRGLSTLLLDPMLTQAARAHSEEMCTADYFDHHSPTPALASPMDRYLSASRQLGLSQPEYLLVGENIYYCSICSDIYNVDYAHRALMASPGHRANILETRFTKIGLGVYRNTKGEFWVTEMFSRDRNP